MYEFTDYKSDSDTAILLIKIILYVHLGPWHTYIHTYYTMTQQYFNDVNILEGLFQILIDWHSYLFFKNVLYFFNDLILFEHTMTT